jgi:cytochrome c5
MIKKTRRLTIAGAILSPCLLLAGCAPQGEDADTAVEMPAFENDRLAQGRGLWLQTCRACHLSGVGGAPAVTDRAEWDKRLPKGEDSLYQSVLNGIRGEDGKYRMPPRGGNDRLTDAQVRLALEYKLASIELLQKQTPDP